MVLLHIWNKGQSKPKEYFENGPQQIQTLHSKFTLLSDKTCTFESVHDYLRAQLNHDKPLQYRYGTNYTDIDKLVRDFTSTKSYGTSRLQCSNCNFLLDKQFLYLKDYTAVGWSSSDREKLQQTASI